MEKYETNRQAIYKDLTPKTTSGDKMRLAHYNKTIEVRDHQFKLMKEESQVIVLIERHKEFYCLKHGWIVARIECDKNNLFNVILYDNSSRPPILKTIQNIKLAPRPPKDILKEVMRLAANRRTKKKDTCSTPRVPENT